MDPTKSYDELASQYHLIFEDWELSVERQGAALSSILQGKCGLATTARILDCACGIGTQSLGLAKMGFRVAGCDLSARAIERARLEASRRNADIHCCEHAESNISRRITLRCGDLRGQCTSTPGERRAAFSGNGGFDVFRLCRPNNRVISGVSAIVPPAAVLDLPPMRLLANCVV
jgi:SAM-dependent methyltransferase